MVTVPVYSGPGWNPKRHRGTLVRPVGFFDTVYDSRYDHGQRRRHPRYNIYYRQSLGTIRRFLVSFPCDTSKRDIDRDHGPETIHHTGGMWVKLDIGKKLQGKSTALRIRESVPTSSLKKYTPPPVNPPAASVPSHVNSCRPAGGFP